MWVTHTYFGFNSFAFTFAFTFTFAYNGEIALKFCEQDSGKLFNFVFICIPSSVIVSVSVFLNRKICWLKLILVFLSHFFCTKCKRIILCPVRLLSVFKRKLFEKFIHRVHQIPFFIWKLLLKKLLNIFSNFLFYLKVQPFRLLMENNFIQMAMQ